MRSVKAPTHLRGSIGFTLIELMIVVTIVAILAAIAIPSYRAYIVRTNRAAAKACMSEFAQFMERYYTTNLTYVGAAPALGCTTEGGLNNNYSISAAVVAATQRTYTITATPVNSQLTSDTQCGTLSVDQAGTRTETGTKDVAYCW
jgi:type IV pilus assembly protein PilE